MSQTTRAYLYRILTFAMAVLAGYDIVADSQVPLWLALGAAVLGLGVASANTPTTKQARIEFRDKPAES